MKKGIHAGLGVLLLLLAVNINASVAVEYVQTGTKGSNLQLLLVALIALLGGYLIFKDDTK